MLQNHESMQVVNYVVNHNYMRSYHVIFPSCHAYAKNYTENDHLVIPFILFLWRGYLVASMMPKTQTVTLVKKRGKGGICNRHNLHSDYVNWTHDSSRETYK